MTCGQAKQQEALRLNYAEKDWSANKDSALKKIKMKHWHLVSFRALNKQKGGERRQSFKHYLRNLNPSVVPHQGHDCTDLLHRSNWSPSRSPACKCAFSNSFMVPHTTSPEGKLRFLLTQTAMLYSIIYFGIWLGPAPCAASAIPTLWAQWETHREAWERKMNIHQCRMTQHPLNTGVLTFCYKDTWHAWTPDPGLHSGHLLQGGQWCQCYSI